MKELSLRPAVLAHACLLVLVAVGCGSNDKHPAAPGGASGGAGDVATGGSGGAAGGEGGAGGADPALGCMVGDGASPVALPVPPGASDQPAPSGTGTDPNLSVLNWAGFGSAVSYTLDDTQPSQIEHWAELKAEGIRMTFNANPTGNWASGYDTTWKEAIALGSEIGNHTMAHCYADLTGCTGNNKKPVGTLNQEIDQCTTYILDRLGQPGVWTTAYPFGDTNYKAFVQSRFFLGRGVGGGMIAASGTTDPFNLPVYAAKGNEEASVFDGQIDAARTQNRWLVFLFHSILPTSNNWYVGVEIASITGSIEYAKAFGDVWLDSMVNVGAYWLGQRTLEAVTPITANGTTTWSWTLPTCFPPGHFLRVKVDGGTLSQAGQPLTWDGHGYYELSLDAGSMTWTP